MKGAYGAMLIALGIFMSIMGGFILNAETVTTCQTEWGYITEASGAFVGDRSDMDVEYSPPSNVTGWSYERGYNEGWISGVEIPKLATRTTAYAAYTGVQTDSSYSMAVTASDTSGTLTSQRYETVSTPGGTYTRDMPEGYGLSNYESATILKIDGRPDVQGAFGASLADIVKGIPGFESSARIVLTVQGASQGYPCFAAINSTLTAGTVTGGSAQATTNATLSVKTATATALTATVMPQEMRAVIGDRSLSAEEAALVWGQASFGGYGPSSASVAISIVASSASERVYLDPAYGVLPVPGTYTTSEATYVDHPGSSSCSATLTFEHPERLSESRSTGTLTFASASGSVAIQWDFMGAHGLDSDTCYLMVTVDGTQHNVSASGRTVSLVASLSAGTVTVLAGGQAAGTASLAGQATAISAVSTSQGAYQAPLTFSAVNQEGEEQWASGGAGSWSFPMSYRSASEQETVHSYDSSWWSNGYDNQSVTVALASSGSQSHSTSFVIYGPGGTASAAVRYSPAQGWYVGIGPYGAEEIDGRTVGKWPAVQVTFSAEGATVRPLGAFTSFTDYKVIDSPVVLSTPILGGSTITDMRVSGDAAMPICVVSTVTRIAEGGLYLQDASLDMPSAFPNLKAWTLSIGSAAHTGTAIIIASGGSSASVQVDGNSAYVGGQWVPLNGLAFRWYDPDAPSASIGSHTYRPSIYMRGQTYDAGIVWADTGKGDMVQVLEAPDGASMTLDGVWAPTVSLYGGENEAAERTELADFTKGEFRWDKNDFVIVMMAVCILGGLAGSYFGKVGGVDWLVIFGAVGVLWLIL